MTLTPAENHLISLDPILGEVIIANGPLPNRPKRGYYEALASSIISQQISVKAAASIFERFENITKVLPDRALDISDEQTKLIGLSGQKARYLSDLAMHFVDNPEVFDHLGELSDDDVISELTQVKGIGVWTAQMFLMFTLARPDVFAPGDRGLQLAIASIYDTPPKPTEAELAHFAKRWSPHRTTASRHLWHSLSNAP